MTTNFKARTIREEDSTVDPGHFDSSITSDGVQEFFFSREGLES